MNIINWLLKYDTSKMPAIIVTLGVERISSDHMDITPDWSLLMITN